MADITALARRAARQAGVPEDLYAALIVHGERSYQGWQRSPVGAYGPAQLMPDTARSLEQRYHVNTRTRYGNLLGGAYYLKEQLHTFGGDRRKAVAAYNAGPGNVQKYGGVPPFQETQRYVQNVFGGIEHQPRHLPGAVGPPAPVSSSIKTTLGQAPGQLKVPPPPKIPSFPIGGSAVIGAATNALGQIAQGDYRPSETLGDLVTAQNVDRDALTKAWGQAQQQAVQPTNIGLDITPGATTRTVRGRDGKTITVRGRVPQEALKAVALAKRYLGTPYHWGGASPQTNFDCSGLLQYVWGQQGVNIPRETYSQWKSGRPVQRKALQAGDAVFFEPTSRGPGHVGMYIGGGMFIESPHTGAVVRIARLADRKDYMGARRYG